MYSTQYTILTQAVPKNRDQGRHSGSHTRNPIILNAEAGQSQTGDYFRL